jgi:hypothetical protein
MEAELTGQTFGGMPIQGAGVRSVQAHDQAAVRKKTTIG